MTTLVLASASAYRRTLLARLGLPFTITATHVDERRRPGEAPAALARRLARAKAEAAAASDAVVIGSDQVVVRGATVLGKPGDHARARAQLQALQGRAVKFLTAVTVLDGPRGRSLEHLDETEVVFRPLTDAEIEAYLLRDQPYDCAGAFKAEGLGIALFERIRSDDPTALIGLPLIWLTGALIAAGLNPLTSLPQP